MRFENYELLFLCESGSVAYGLNDENSDVDVRGVFMNTKSELFGFKTEDVLFREPDTKLFSLRRFCELSMRGHSGSLELLGLSHDLYKYETSLWNELVENQSLFLSKRVLYMANGNAEKQEKEIAKKLKSGDFRRASKYMSHALRIYDFATTSAKTGRFVARPSEEMRLFLKSVKDGLFVVDGKVSDKYYESLEEFKARCEKVFLDMNVPESCDKQKVEDLLVSLTERGLLLYEDFSHSV